MAVWRGCRSASTAATTVGSGAGAGGRLWSTPSGGSRRRIPDGCARRTGGGSRSRRATGRCTRAGRGRARGPLERLLLVGVALVLRNVWVWLHYAILSTPRRGNCRYNLERLTLRTMLQWLQHQAEEELGLRDEVLSERPIPQRIGA